jgi:transposase, IS6 family
VLMRRSRSRPPAPRSSFTGFRFPPEVITVAVRWYLRYGLSYRNVEELLAERGIEVDPSTLAHTPRDDLGRPIQTVWVPNW